MRAGLSVYELGVHPHLIAAVLFAPLQHIAHAEVSADLLHVRLLALVGERGAARDHERAVDPRKVRGQTSRLQEFGLLRDRGPEPAADNLARTAPTRRDPAP